MRKLVLAENPNAIRNAHIKKQREKMSESEQQRIIDAEIKRDLRESQRISDAQLKTDMRRASERK